MNIEMNRKLGGIGSLLTLVGAVGSVFTLTQYPTGALNSTALSFGVLGVIGAISMAALVGFILFLVAMYGFSKDYQQPKIFNNILYGLIAAVVSAIIIGAIWFVAFMANIFSLIPTIASSTSTQLPSSQIQEIITPYTAILSVAMSLVMLVWIFFFYKSLNLLAGKSEVLLFRSAAKVFVLGTIITVVLSIVFAAIGAYGTMDFAITTLVAIPGSAVQYVAWAVAAKGFFRIKVPPQTDALPVWTVNSAVWYCTNCGTPNQAESTYCTRCGRKLS